MSTATVVDSAPRYWSEEASNGPDRVRIRARIGGLHCSLCTGTIEKALGRQPGVDKVAVSLTHEQALIEYDPQVARPEELFRTLRDIGYSVSDPRKLRPFEEEERDLVREGRLFLAATAFGGTSVLAAIAAGLLPLKGQAWFSASIPWIVAFMAAVLVFGVGRHILRMAVQALRRGILNQHVLLEIGAFAGMAGGVIGFVLDRPGYPTAAFFAVTVMVTTYHIFSEWLSLIVKTRSSQAVKRLLDLRPETARVVRGAEELELPLESVVVGDRVRIRPGERVPVDGRVASGRSAVDH